MAVTEEQDTDNQVIGTELLQDQASDQESIPLSDSPRETVPSGRPVRNRRPPQVFTYSNLGSPAVNWYQANNITAYPNHGGTNFAQPYSNPLAPLYVGSPVSYPYHVGAVQVPTVNLPNKSATANVQCTNFNDATLRELIKLQERQTELSEMLANQQRISSLPVQEPPTFNGDFFEYPTFVRAFEAIIENKVSSDRDRLYFLNKYTVGKANDVVKGFVTLNTDDGYKEARNSLRKDSEIHFTSHRLTSQS
ncbi:hypothetical protein QZH41_011076 [Actinostola sp. cb2023]|nr:hypothetical protein QZH41_011076 [Actinostola sp. cb2023]